MDGFDGKRKFSDLFEDDLFCQVIDAPEPVKQAKFAIKTPLIDSGDYQSIESLFKLDDMSLTTTLKPLPVV